MFNFKLSDRVNGSNTTNDTNELEWNEWYHVRAVLAPFTVITNLTVVISSGVILNTNVEPRALYMFMGNLALADLLHGGMTIAELLLRIYTHHTIIYVIQLGLNLTSILASSLGVCVIAIDRYIFLKYSIYYTIWITKITAKRIILGVWIYSSIVGFICELIFYQPVSKKYINNRFITITPIYLLDVIACSLVLPICVTVVLYTSVLITVFKLRQKESQKAKVEYSRYKDEKQDQTWLQHLKLKTTFDNKAYVDENSFTVSENVTQEEIRNSNHDHTCFSVDLLIQHKVSNFRVNSDLGKVTDINFDKGTYFPKISHLQLKLEKDQTKAKLYKISTKPQNTSKRDDCLLSNSNKDMVCGRGNSFITSMNNDFDNYKRDSDSSNTSTIKSCASNGTLHHRKKFSARSFIMVFLVMFVFTASWGPYCVTLIVFTIFCHRSKVPEDSGLCSNLQFALNTFLLSLGFLNALINPFLYCWWHKGFRASLHKICCKNNIREKKRNDFVSSLRY